jgi:hypothetical protein
VSQLSGAFTITIDADKLATAVAVKVAEILASGTVPAPRHAAPYDPDAERPVKDFAEHEFPPRAGQGGTLRGDWDREPAP